MIQQRSLKDRICLVTGSSSGIGFCIAKVLLECEAIVGLHYCSNRAGAEELKKTFGDRCALFQANFAHSQQVLRLWNDFIDWSGGIAVLVNNAGAAISPVALSELSEDVWDGTMQVNVKAPLLLSQASMQVMRQRKWGRIINMSSIGVKFGGGTSTAHYSASKAALEALTLSLAKEGAPHNVLVNAIRAGVTESNFHSKMGRSDLSERAQLIPLKRLASPQEIANMALFLASDESSFVTGSIFPVAGGE